MTAPSARAAARARRAAHSDVVVALARAGYAVKGALYALIGVLALLAALGEGGAATGTKGAIRAVASSSYGEALLGLIAAGLVAYALWRFVQAALDPEHKGADAEGVVKRLGYAGSGVAYGGLALWTLRLLMGDGGGSGDSADTWTAALMRQPFGPWLVGLAGAVGVVLGLYQLHRAWAAAFRKRLATGAMSPEAQRWAVGIGRFGLAARGVVFGLIGAFLVVAALQADPTEARDLDGVLQTLQRQPAGPYLLGLAALGLAAYGGYCFVNARYRRIPG